MKSFFERLQLNIKNNPQKIVLRSDKYPNGYSYKQLDEASGKVCQYLKERNIGKEDFVMILLPREASAYVSLIGVWKSGAGIVLLEEDYSSERVVFIKNDLKCKLIITSEVFDEMMKGSTCEKYSLPSSHDACYATYTSGTTGNPKGILHEFGKLDTFDYDYQNQLLQINDDCRFAIVTPLSFGPSIRNAVTAFMYGKCLYIVPKNIVKNPKLLLQYFNDNRINETSVTCSFFRAYPFKTKYMKNVFVHSEPCSGVFEKGVNVVNLYTLSEVAFPVCSFKIDKPYINAPLGYANNNFKIKIINSNGEKVKQNEIGEIVVKNVFTRGYINLHKKTEEVFKDGYFYTGDLGYFDKDKMIYLCGRKDDMIKINGNRIEPIEIEAIIKKVFDIKNVVVKGFVADKRSFVEAYLLKDEVEAKHLLNTEGRFFFSIEEMKNKLQKFLPDYMIPSCYMVLDHFPANEVGKLLRQDLPAPKISDYVHEDETSQNTLEDYFCHLFESVLDIDKVGANDDFYQIGGDSFSSMELLNELDDFDLTYTDIYQERTPRNLSRRITHVVENDNLKSQNQKALLIPQSLLTEQQAVFEGQRLFPDLNTNNLTRFFKLRKGTDVEKLSSAIDKVFRNHPVFSSILFNDNGIEKICYKPELYKSIEIKKISQEELENIKNNSFKPFELENHLLYRSSIYLCDNIAYFFLEIHHLITDGFSLKKLFIEIANCYHDEQAILEPDYLFLLLQKNAIKSSMQDMPLFKIRELYQINDFMKEEVNTIKYDYCSMNLIPSRYAGDLHIKKKKILESNLFKKYKGNVFFLTCFLKTISEFNKQEKVFSFWTYMGRENKKEQNIHGLLIRTMPMGIVFDLSMNIEKAFEFVKDSISRQLAIDASLTKALTDDFMLSPYFIYQKDILHNECLNDVFEERIISQVCCMPFELHLIDNIGEPLFNYVVKYSAGLYEEKTIKHFCELFEKVIKQTIDGK